MLMWTEKIHPSLINIYFSNIDIMIIMYCSSFLYILHQLLTRLKEKRYTIM